MGVGENEARRGECYVTGGNSERVGMSIDFTNVNVSRYQLGGERVALNSLLPYLFLNVGTFVYCILYFVCTKSAL